MSDCPQCGHPWSTHWPDHGQSTTACVVCLDKKIVSETADGRRGFCCHSAPKEK